MSLDTFAQGWIPGFIAGFMFYRIFLVPAGYHCRGCTGLAWIDRKNPVQAIKCPGGPA